MDQTSERGAPYWLCPEFPDDYEFNNIMNKYTNHAKRRAYVVTIDKCNP